MGTKTSDPLLHVPNIHSHARCANTSKIHLQVFLRIVCIARNLHHWKKSAHVKNLHVYEILDEQDEREKQTL